LVDGGEAVRAGVLEQLVRRGLRPSVPPFMHILPEAWRAGDKAVIFTARFGDSDNLWSIRAREGDWIETTGNIWMREPTPQN
jgi:hypothetical protein